MMGQTINTALLVAVVLIILNLIMVTGIATIGFLLRGKSEDNKEKFKKVDEKHEKLAGKFTDFKENLPLTYVTRDNFTTALTGFDSKLDIYGKTLKEVQKMLNAKMGTRRKDGSDIT